MIERDIIAQEGYRIASTTKARVLEAAKLFNEGATRKSHHAEYRLQEAFTTSDFPKLLGKAFEIQAIQVQKDAVAEWPQIADSYKVSDFEKKKLVDLFGKHYFDDVAAGEEYKADTLKELETYIRAGKTGRKFGLTWEMRLRRDFTNLADFPRLLGNAAVRTEDKKVFQEFVNETGPRTDFFQSIDNKPLTADNLQTAIDTIALRKDHREELVDTSSLVLVVPPSLRITAERIVNSAEVELSDGNKKYRIQNPFRGLVKILVSRNVATLDKSATMATTWYLLPSPGSDNPALGKISMIGQESIDIRVQRNQGDRVGGGEVPFDEGSFDDDTIWYRGRHITGGAKIFNYATYASKGA